MDGIGIGNFGSGNNIRDIQVRMCTQWRTDTNSFIGEFDMQTIYIGFRVYGYGFNAHFFTGSDNPQRYFSSIGYEYFLKHGTSNEELNNEKAFLIARFLFYI